MADDRARLRNSDCEEVVALHVTEQICRPSCSSATNGACSIARGWRRGWRADCDWLVSSSSVTSAGRLWRAARREIRRVGLLGFLDVVAFRAFARCAWHDGDTAWEARTVEELRRRYPVDLEDVPHISPWRRRIQRRRPHLSRALQPDLVIARCKVILKPDIVALPRAGHVRAASGHLPRIPQRARLLLGAGQP